MKLRGADRFDVSDASLGLTEYAFFWHIVAPVLEKAVRRRLEMRSNDTLSLSRANGQAPTGRAAQVQELAPDALERVLSRLKEQWKSYRKQLRKSRRKFSGKAVHDLRVEARRLISLMDLLSPFVPAACISKAREELKGQLDTFDDLRDAQVQLGATNKLRKRFVAARDFHRHLKKHEEQLRKVAKKDSKRVHTKPLSKLVKEARECVKRWQQRDSKLQANSLLLGSIGRAFERTKYLKDRIDPHDTHSIHYTRIAFKKFRYMIEALAGQASRAKGLLERLRQYQGRMGDIQDAEVLLRSFEKFFRKQKTEVGPARQFAKASLQRRRELIRKFLASADELMEFWPPSKWKGALRSNGKPHSPRDRTVAESSRGS